MKKGQRHSPESIEKIRIARKGKYSGKNHPMFGKTGRKSPWFGKKHKPETIEKMRVAQLREKHPNWKGGYYKHEGYILILKPKHPSADIYGYVRKSHLVAEKKLGRLLRKEEVTHHKNGIRDDDRPENIEVFSSKAKHTSFHNQKRRQMNE